MRVVLAAAFAFALTVGLANGARYIVDAAAEISRCIDPGGAATAAARHLVDTQRTEVTRNLAHDRGVWTFFLMTVLLVPLVEERVYRGLVQRVIAERWGLTWGIAASAVLFGLAHLGVYRVAVYQTALLGVAFGTAYAEGGLFAAVLAHAAWNFHLLL